MFIFIQLMYDSSGGDFQIKNLNLFSSRSFLAFQDGKKRIDKDFQSEFELKSIEVEILRLSNNL